MLCAAIILCASCDETEEIILPIDQSSIGLISTPKRYAQIGRPFEVACITDLSKHAENAVISWKTGNEATTPEDEHIGQISYKTYTWNEPGTKEITCRADYRYAGKAANRSQTSTIHVLPYLYGDCYPSDSLSLIQELHPGMALIEEEGYSKYYEEKRSETETHSFLFYQNQLKSKTIIYYTFDQKAAFYQDFLAFVANHKDEFTQDIKLKCRIYTDNLSTEIETILTKINNREQLTDQEAKELNPYIANRKVSLLARITNNYFNEEAIWKDLALVSLYDNSYHWAISYKKATIR